MHHPHHSHHHHMYELCKQHIHSYVLVETNDGSKVDGVIIGLDNDYVYLAVPNTGYNSGRGAPGFGYPPVGYGYPPYGYGFPGYGYGPAGRFRRLVLPLTALVALSALPWY